MFENMLVNMLKAFGVTPEKINATVDAVVSDVSEIKRRLTSIESKLDFLNRATPVLALEETNDGSGDDSGTSH